MFYKGIIDYSKANNQLSMFKFLPRKDDEQNNRLLHRIINYHEFEHPKTANFAFVAS